MSGRMTTVLGNLAPEARQWTAVSHGATNEPPQTRPGTSSTRMEVPPSMRMERGRAPRHSAWPAMATHHTPAAARVHAQPGMQASNTSVARLASAMKTASRREGARVSATSASLYWASMSDLVADLSHNALLSVSGDDAAAFLHGQFTNDVQALAVGEAQWNGWCSPKGRLLATFLLLRRAEDFVMMLPTELAAPIAKRLTMFVLRSKVKIRDISDVYARRGIIGPRAEPGPMRVLEKEGTIRVGLEPGRVIALSAPEAAAPPNASADAWELASIHAGVPVITAATQEAFVPQMANFDLVGGVSFKKGCYPGQEIVARTQYRGGLKRRMALAHIDGAERPAPGQSVYSGAFGDQSAGTIVNAAPAPEGGFDALVVAQIESLGRGDLRWKSPDGPRLEIRSHPPLAAAS